ncbi:hypothetical protein G6F66_014649 [Rhizopus arrhizus]|nr:hypothetical protein G6F66_014649 [Rhizopus arrhizus]
MGNKESEKETRLMLWAKRRYEPLLEGALRRTPLVLAGATLFVVLCGVLASRLGSEFIPNLNEGDMAIQALRTPGTILTQSVEMQKQIEKRLKDKFPEIERHLGRLHHAQARGPMAHAAQDARRAAGGHPGRSRPGTRHQR